MGGDVIDKKDAAPTVIPGIRAPLALAKDAPDVAQRFEQHYDEASNTKVTTLNATPDIFKQRTVMMYTPKVEESPAKETFQALTNFEHNSSELTAAHKAALMRQVPDIFRSLSSNEGTEVEAHGFADKSGNNADYNMKISQARAANVQKFLQDAVAKEAQKHGKDPESFRNRLVASTTAHGDTELAVDTEQANGENRQVKLTLRQKPTVNELQVNLAFSQDQALGSRRSLEQEEAWKKNPDVRYIPFTVDGGKGPVALREFGKIPGFDPNEMAESQAKIVFDRVESKNPDHGSDSVDSRHREHTSATPQHPLRFNVLHGDPSLLTFALRTVEGNEKLECIQTDPTHVQIKVDGKPFAYVHVTGPDGQPRDLSKMHVYAVDRHNHHRPEVPVVSVAAQFADVTKASGIKVDSKHLGSKDVSIPTGVIGQQQQRSAQADVPGGLH